LRYFTSWNVPFSTKELEQGIILHYSGKISAYKHSILQEDLGRMAPNRFKKNTGCEGQSPLTNRQYFNCSRNCRNSKFRCHAYQDFLPDFLPVWFLNRQCIHTYVYIHLYIGSQAGCYMCLALHSLWFDYNSLLRMYCPSSQTTTRI
jgi:hypothetical protein